MPERKLKLRHTSDYERLQWPPGRSDISAAAALIVFIIAVVAGQWTLVGIAFVIGIAVFEWPTLETGRLEANPGEGSVAIEATRRVEGSYSVQRDVPRIESSYTVRRDAPEVEADEAVEIRQPETEQVQRQ